MWLSEIREVAITDRRLMQPSFGDAIARRLARSPAGTVLVQVREKDLDGAALLALVREALATGARVAVNDRVDIALAAGAHAVHLPERGLPVAVVRRLAPQLVIGRSIHVPADAACGADLVQLGPIFETPGKGPALGVAALAIARSLTAARLVAVGGMAAAHDIEAARVAGADAIAAIRDAWRP